MKGLKMKKQNGFSMMELLLVLTVGTTLTVGATVYYNKVQEKNNKVNQARYLSSYSIAIYNFISNNQAILHNGKTNFPIVTISKDQLLKYGVVRNGEFSDVYDKQTGSKLYPCAVAYYQNNKLQGFVYYRTDDPKLSVTNSNNNTDEQMLSSLNSIGANGGVITKNNNSYFIKSNSGSWNLTQNQITQYLTQQGGDFLGDGLAKCQGQYIATPSYILTMNNSLNEINGELAADNNIKQNTNEILNNNPNNITDTINLDSTGLSATPYKQTSNNKLIFQSNSTCQMNPSILSTMQDYDENCPGINCSYNTNGNYKKNCNNINDLQGFCGKFDIPNKFGCRNKQLTLGVQDAKVCSSGTSNCSSSTTKSLSAVVINGFDKVQTSYTTLQNQGYLGGLNADAIQATAQVGYGDSCDLTEVGSMAQQQTYPDTTTLNKIYNLNQSLLVCQKSLLCSANQNFDGNTANMKACWLPISTVTVDINFNVNDRVLAFEAPSGFYIKSVEYYDKDETVWIGDYGNNTQFGLQRVYGIYGSYTREGICRKEVNNGIGGLCHTETHGDILNMPNNILTAIPDGNIYAPYKATFSNLYNPSDSTILKGFGGIIDKLNVKSFDFTNYFTSCANGAQNSGPCAYVTNNSNSATNYTNNALKQFNYKFGISFAYQVNPKFAIRQSRWRHYGNGCNNLSDCDNWKFGKFLTIPYYIKKITLSNDTDNLAIDSNNPPPAPPIPPPPSGQCSATANMPAYMNQEAKDAMNNYNYDPNTGNQLVLAKSNNFNITSTNSNQYNCNVQATANYCPAQSTTNCKYDITISMARGLKQGSPCHSGTWLSNSGVANGWSGRDEYCGSPRKHCSYSADNTRLNQWVSLVCDDAGMGNQMTTITAGSCAPANQCTNPITKVIYQNGYSF